MNALISCTTGNFNACIGHGSLQSVTTGQRNTGIGINSGQNITTGSTNTCIGVDAGQTLQTGSNNTFLGFGAGIGASTTQANEIILGNSSISAIRCQQQTISSLSDRRDKKDIEDLTIGLDFINTLKPRKFTWQMRSPSTNDGKTQTGFIAQELQESVGENLYLNLVDNYNDETLHAAMGNLMPIVIKAIQQLSAKVKALEAG